MEEASNSSLDPEDILQKHRQERKELQARIVALKKSVPKNDKKKKKEVADNITQLESELEEKHKQELGKVSSPVAEEEQEEPAKERSKSTDDTDEEPPEKLTRAQRRRNKKESEDKARSKYIQEQETVNKRGPRNQELATITQTLQKEGLQLHNIPADGNCLYCAVQHQLEVTERESLEVEELRELTAEFMRSNKDDFIPFMCNDSGDSVDEQHFEKYCKDVASTTLWGGQLELRALSNILKCPIKIIQASGPPTIQGEQFNGVPLVLTYHRHLYRLGEHYNSTVVCKPAESEEGS